MKRFDWFFLGLSFVFIFSGCNNYVDAFPDFGTQSTGGTSGTGGTVGGGDIGGGTGGTGETFGGGDIGGGTGGTGGTDEGLWGDDPNGKIFSDCSNPRFYGGPFNFVTNGYSSSLLDSDSGFKDPLQGSASSKATVSGGEFVSDGWRTKTQKDYISYRTESLFGKNSISKGAVEFEAKGWKAQASTWAVVDTGTGDKIKNYDLPKTTYNPNQWDLNVKRSIFVTCSNNCSGNPTSDLYKFGIRLYGFSPRRVCDGTYCSDSDGNPLTPEPTCDISFCTPFPDKTNESNYCYKGSDETYEDISDLWGVLKVRLSVNEGARLSEDVEDYCNKQTNKAACLVQNGYFEEYLVDFDARWSESNSEATLKSGNIVQGGSADVFPWNWDSEGNTWYRFRIEWGIEGKIAKVFVNGVIATKYDYTNSYDDYAPPNQAIRIGAGEFSAPLGVTFRNFKAIDLTN